MGRTTQTVLTNPVNTTAVEREVRVGFTLVTDLSDFDETSFKAQLALEYGVPVSAISLDASAGSVVVSVVIDVEAAADAGGADPSALASSIVAVDQATLTSALGGALGVDVTLAALPTVVSHNVTTTSWSEPITWWGGELPGEGDTAIIPFGHTVVLDVSPPPLDLLLVQGALVFARMDLALTANRIFVAQGASFVVGTEADPFLHSAVITLTGSPISHELPVYGTKVLACRECTIDLHGAPVGHSWTRLGLTAVAGADTITLLVPVDWAVGSAIVVASTSHESTEAEETTVLGVEAGGTRLRLASPLRFEHMGETVEIAGHSIEMRAEVGLLSRNVVVQGDAQSAPSQFGATIMLHSDGDNSLVGRHPPTRVELAISCSRAPSLLSRRL